MEPSTGTGRHHRARPPQARLAIAHLALGAVIGAGTATTILLLLFLVYRKAMAQ